MTAPVLVLVWAGPGTTEPRRVPELFDRYGSRWHKCYADPGSWTLSGEHGYTVKWTSEAMAEMNPFTVAPRSFHVKHGNEEY